MIRPTDPPLEPRSEKPSLKSGRSGRAAPQAHALRGPALAALFAGALAIATAPILAKMSISSGVGAVATAFWRMVLSIPMLVIAAGWQRQRRAESILPGPSAAIRTDPAGHLRSGSGSPPATRAWLWLSLPGVIFALDLATWHLSFAYTPLANATLLANFATIWVALVSWRWFGERFSWMFITGSALALGGVAVILRIDFHISPHMLRGDGLALITSLFYAAYILSIKRLRRGFTVMQIMLYSSTASALALLPISLLLGESVLPRTPQAWGALAVLALISHCAGQGLITWALAHLPASLSAVSLLVQPVGAAILANLVLGEVLGPWQIAGGTVVLAGIGLARLGSRL